MDIYAIANKMKLEGKTIHDLKINVTFYARVSTTREEQENSIESQIEYFTKMIRANPNWTYIEGYVDKVRGENAENRISFMRMIDDGKAGKFDLVITKEVSRFARNTIDSLTYTRELLRAGVGVFFQNDNICTIDTDSELRLTIMSSIAADEVRKLSERVKWGHKRAIEKGRVIGNSRIFGYDKDDCRLKINEPEAEMVKLIFNLYSTGDYSTRKIENILYEKGYRGRNGTRIHHNTISGIIQNPKYKGYYCGNKVKIVDYRTKEQKFLPKEEWVLYKDDTGNIVPAIVSEEIWDKCNEIFEERSIAVKNKGRSFKDRSVFTGKIYCSVHDKPYWRTSYSNTKSKGLSVYQWLCSEKKRFGASSCPSSYILESELYDMLSKVFKDMADNIQDYITTFIEIYKETDSENSLKKQIDLLKQQLYKENQKREKILDLYMDGSISKEEFTKRNSNYTVLITDIENNIDELKSKMDEEMDYTEGIKKIESYFLNMYNPEVSMSKEQIDEITKTLVERIYVTPIDKKTMSLEIQLKNNMQKTTIYDIQHYKSIRRSGHIFLNIIPKRQFSYTHINRRSLGHKDYIVFLVNMGI